MNKTITITINTGNETMQSDNDVANALVELARRIKTKGLDYVSKVMDDNGNSVGTVTVENN